MDLDAVPSLMNWKPPLGIIVASAGGNSHDFMSGFHQSKCQVGQMLGRRDMIWVETLIEKQNPHA